MNSQKSRAVFTLMSLAAALALFSPITGAAQTQHLADPGASAPKPKILRFSQGADDLAFRMTTDATGNIYIAADLDDLVHPNSFAVIKYNRDGKLLGVFRFKAFAAAAIDVKVDANDNIYAGGFSSRGGEVVSFSPSGNIRWSRVLGDSVDALALDRAGNVYAGGTINQTSMLVAKFTANGSLLWQKAHQGTTSFPCNNGFTPGNCVTDIRVDGNDNLIAFGFTSNANPALDNTTLKINPQGKLLWVRNFAQQPLFDKVPAAGAVDHDNGIYATGQGVNRFTGDRFPYTLKYDTDGKLKFVLMGAGNGGSSVAVDPAGKILLGGFTLVHGSPAETASKFDPSGKRIWVTQVPSSGKIVSDAKGNVFAAGDFYSVTKLSPAGKIISTFDGQSQFPGILVSDAVVDPFGSLLVTGFGFDQKRVMTEIVTLKFPKNFSPHPAQ